MRCLYCHNPDSWKMRAGEEMEADQLLDSAERFRPYWGSEGGITVSGGEALMQIDFLLELFTKAKQRGITTCLDTSAQPFRRNEPFFGKFEQLMSVTDTVLLDIKHIRDAEHRRLTGHTNENILDCARYLSERGVPVWIRHVLVPGITDNEDCLHQLATFISSLCNVQRVDVLPYHTLGIFKYEKLGITYPLPDVPAPSAESVRRAQDVLSAAIQHPKGV